MPAPLGPMIPTIPARRQRERQLVDEQQVAIALAESLDLDHGVPQSRPGRDGDLQLALLDSARVLRLGKQLLVGAESSLALGLPGLRAHADPFELARERVLPRVDLLLLPR